MYFRFRLGLRCINAVPPPPPQKWEWMNGGMPMQCRVKCFTRGAPSIHTHTHTWLIASGVFHTEATHADTSSRRADSPVCWFIRWGGGRNNNNINAVSATIVWPRFVRSRWWYYPFFAFASPKKKCATCGKRDDSKEKWKTKWKWWRRERESTRARVREKGRTKEFRNALNDN